MSTGTLPRRTSPLKMPHINLPNINLPSISLPTLPPPKWNTSQRAAWEQTQPDVIEAKMALQQAIADKKMTQLRNEGLRYTAPETYELMMTSRRNLRRESPKTLKAIKHELGPGLPRQELRDVRKTQQAGVTTARLEAKKTKIEEKLDKVGSIVAEEMFGSTW